MKYFRSPDTLVSFYLPAYLLTQQHLHFYIATKNWSRLRAEGWSRPNSRECTCYLCGVLGSTSWFHRADWCILMWETIKHEILVCDCCSHLFAPSAGCGGVICDLRDDSRRLVFVSWYTELPASLIQHWVIHFRNLGHKFYFQEHWKIVLSHITGKN